MCRDGIKVYTGCMKETSTPSQTEVDKNYSFFKEELPELLKEHKGKFVLIREQNIEGMFETFEQAFLEGKERFSDNLFSIQEVTEESVDLGSVSAYAIL